MWHSVCSELPSLINRSVHVLLFHEDLLETSKLLQVVLKNTQY